jgi:hypothetical protein
MLAAAVLIAAGIVLLVQCFSDSYPFDLAYFTTAGRMWREGVDPYGAAFADFGSRYIAREAALWAYPPQWWWIATPLSTLSDAASVIVWKIVNVSALIGGGALVYRVHSNRSPCIPGVTAVLFAVMLMTADATRIGLHLGQTNALMLLGFGMLVDGMQRKTTSRTAIGLFVLMLKPQFGLFFVLLALTLKDGRRPAALALLATALACLPVLLTFGVSGTLLSAGRFLHNLSAYGALDWNRPGELTGVSFLAPLLGLPAPSPIVCIAAAGALTLWLDRKSGRDPINACMIGLAALYAIVPLHPYDLIMLPLFLLVLDDRRPWAATCVLVGLVLAWHASTSAFQYLGTAKTADGILLASIIQSGTATLAATLVFAAVAFGQRMGLIPDPQTR